MTRSSWRVQPPMVANGKVYVASFSHIVFGLRLGYGFVQDIALNKPATSTSAPCSGIQGTDKAVDGLAVALTDKWCTQDAAPTLQIDLGALYGVNEILISTTWAGGEDATWNTRDFTLQLSSDGTNFTTVASVTGNTANRTVHDFASTTARYVRLKRHQVDLEHQHSDSHYEVEVYGALIGGGGGGGGTGGEAGTGGASGSAGSSASGGTAGEGQVGTVNLALNRPTSSASTACSATEGTDKSVNGASPSTRQMVHSQRDAVARCGSRWHRFGDSDHRQARGCQQRRIPDLEHP